MKMVTMKTVDRGTYAKDTRNYPHNWSKVIETYSQSVMQWIDPKTGYLWAQAIYRKGFDGKVKIVYQIRDN